MLSGPLLQLQLPHSAQPRFLSPTSADIHPPPKRDSLDPLPTPVTSFKANAPFLAGRISLNRQGRVRVQM